MDFSGNGTEDIAVKELLLRVDGMGQENIREFLTEVISILESYF